MLPIAVDAMGGGYQRWFQGEWSDPAGFNEAKITTPDPNDKKPAYFFMRPLLRPKDLASTAKACAAEARSFAALRMTLKV